MGSRVLFTQMSFGHTSIVNLSPKSGVASGPNQCAYAVVAAYDARGFGTSGPGVGGVGVGVPGGGGVGGAGGAGGGPVGTTTAGPATGDGCVGELPPHPIVTRRSATLAVSCTVDRMSHIPFLTHVT
jgi:hypothetical protein